MFVRSCAAAPLRTWTLFVLIGYLLAAGAGMTTSSIGIEPLRDQVDQAPKGLIAGGPDAIRSDEFLRATPWNIGLMKEGDGDFGTPFSYSEHVLVALEPGGPVNAILFLETDVMVTLGRVLPEQAFSLVWWLPVVLVLILLPLWFRQLGVAPHVSIPVTLLVALAPVSIWWSWSALVPIARALVAATAAHAAWSLWHRRDSLRWLVVPLVLFSAIGIARLALSYAPWAVPLGLAIMLPTLANMLSIRGRRLAGGVLAAAATAVGAVLLLLFLHEQGDSLKVIGETVYPGSRRSSGDLAGYALTLAAPHLWSLQTDVTLVNANRSEISSGFMILALVALVLVSTMPWRRLVSHRAALYVGWGVFLACLAWCTFYWPTWTSEVPGLSLVAPSRLVQILGLGATILFGQMFGAWARTHKECKLPTAITVAVMAFFVTGGAGSLYRQLYTPEARAVPIWIAAFVTAAVLGIAVRFASRWWSLVPAVLAAVPLVLFVNPVQLGFGDLVDGTYAKTLRAIDEDRTNGKHWASDSIYEDAFLMANALPSLSGQQWVGPNKAMWHKLDPEEEYAWNWNRGASYLTFSWAKPGAATSVDLPNLDTIRITTDPCSRDMQDVGLGIITAGARLTNSCLELKEHVLGANGERWIYEVGGRT